MSVLEALCSWRYAKAQPTAAVRRVQSCSAVRLVLTTGACMAAIGKERELRPHWLQIRELMLQEADVAAVTWRVRLAVLKDAKLDVSALLSEPLT